MRKKLFAGAAFALVAALSALSVYANDSAVNVFGIWSEPAAEQLRSALDNRMVLPDLHTEAYAQSIPLANRYYFNVQFSYCELNAAYSPIGYTSYQNTGSQNVVLPYYQGAGKTTPWNVTGNISGNAEIRMMILAKVQAMTGMPVEMSVSTASSSTTAATMTVPPFKTGYIYAYHSAVEVQGSISWADMTDDGVITGGGKENVGGALIVNGVHFENEVK